MAEDNKLGDTPLYYFEGCTNPPKMGFVGRKIVEMVTKEKVTYQDNTDKKTTAELLKAVKSLSIKLRERFLDYQIYYLNLD